ncbi:type IV toxin-antitoxin system AbiEi family antitoxin domain-containing protein [Bifidobacterium asteroides]|uniref:AbiEi antitoxin C-terminal domain-containing protein n=1 Tax=Bifidobacterium asteroides TaxID=1684 RepID=A0A6N7TVR6_9BIFI|nr:hypothetical protein [Bifidobacterium asteroides]MSD91682.1 hypothetical protein [Bifidobacterium asteroides]
MSLQYIFYKRFRPKDMHDAVISESSDFNYVLNMNSIKKVYQSLQRHEYLPQRTSLTRFKGYILSPDTDLFTELHLVRKTDGKQIVRLIPRSRPISPFAIALSLAPNSYISHYSALYLHELTLNIPKPIYVKKGRKKPKKHYQKTTKLTQEQLNLAFSKPARTTSNIYTFEYEGVTREIYLLDKSATVDTGITKIPSQRAPSGLPVSSVEKTLIECAIRTNYAGGASEVLEAFRRAKNRLRILRMMQLLMDGDYLFPYEKNILFYMDRAGYSEHQKELARSMEKPDKKKLITYLEAGMCSRQLDSKIGIYYPKGMGNK